MNAVSEHRAGTVVCKVVCGGRGGGGGNGRRGGVDQPHLPTQPWVFVGIEADGGDGWGVKCVKEAVSVRLICCSGVWKGFDILIVWHGVGGVFLLLFLSFLFHPSTLVLISISDDSLVLGATVLEPHLHLQQRELWDLVVFFLSDVYHFFNTKSVHVVKE